MSDTQPTFTFPMLWTLGFSGKRLLPAGSEPKVTAALDQAIEFLIQKADEQDSQLTTVSSIARGADMLFAQACQKERKGAADGLPSGNRMLWLTTLPSK